MNPFAASSRSLGHRAPLLWLVGPYMGGLLLGRAAEFASPRMQLALAIPAIGIAAWGVSRGTRIWAAAIVAAMICAGSAAYSLHRRRLPEWDTLPPREAKLTLRIERVFAPSNSRLVSGLAQVLAAAGPVGELVGQRIYFSLAPRKGEPVPIRSAQVSAIGVLLALPRNPPVDTFDGYLAAVGMNFKFTRGRFLGEEKPAARYYRFCAAAAHRCKAILGEGLEARRPLLAGLLRAMMLGETHELSDEQRRLFMESGTMHLFAISGLNIAVVAGSIQAVLLLLRLPAAVRFAVGICGLWLFVDITGAAPSAVRAFIMAGFLQAALVLRQPGNPLAGMVASAFVVLLISPLQLFSASFLMSYGIVTALLVLGLPLGEAWVARWQPWRDLPWPAWAWWQRAFLAGWRSGAKALAIGVATTLVSLLTSVQFFRLLTPGALLANLALIPAAMVATLGGFVSLVCGLLGLPAGAVLCNHAAALVLLVIEYLVATSVKLPGAFAPAHFIAPWIGTGALVALMLALVLGYAAGWQRERGGWWPPFAIVAVTLLVGVRIG